MARRAPARSGCSTTCAARAVSTGSSPCVGEEHVSVEPAALVAGADHVDDSADAQRPRARHVGLDHHDVVELQVGARPQCRPRTRAASSPRSPARALPSCHPRTQHLLRRSGPRCARRISAASPRRWRSVVSSAPDRIEVLRRARVAAWRGANRGSTAPAEVGESAVPPARPSRPRPPRGARVPPSCRRSRGGSARRRYQRVALEALLAELEDRRALTDLELREHLDARGVQVGAGLTLDHAYDRSGRRSSRADRRRRPGRPPRLRRSARASVASASRIRFCSPCSGSKGAVPATECDSNASTCVPIVTSIPDGVRPPPMTMQRPTVTSLTLGGRVDHAHPTENDPAKPGERWSSSSACSWASTRRTPSMNAQHGTGAAAGASIGDHGPSCSTSRSSPTGGPSSGASSSEAPYSGSQGSTRSRNSALPAPDAPSSAPMSPPTSGHPRSPWGSNPCR